MDKMKRRKEIQAGKKFGRWTVLSYSHTDSEFGFSYWNCVCDCGTERKAAAVFLRAGKTKSCGCYRREASKERMAHALSLRWKDHVPKPKPVRLAKPPRLRHPKAPPIVREVIPKRPAKTAETYEQRMRRITLMNARIGRDE